MDLSGSVRNLTDSRSPLCLTLPINGARRAVSRAYVDTGVVWLRPCRPLPCLARGRPPGRSMRLWIVTAHDRSTVDLGTLLREGSASASPGLSVARVSSGGCVVPLSPCSRSSALTHALLRSRNASAASGRTTVNAPLRAAQPPAPWSMLTTWISPSSATACSTRAASRNNTARQRRRGDCAAIRRASTTYRIGSVGAGSEVGLTRCPVSGCGRSCPSSPAHPRATRVNCS